MGGVILPELSTQLKIKSGALMSRIAINGFGRIGRSILRIIVEQQSDIEVVAINDLGDYKNQHTY